MTKQLIFIRHAHRDNSQRELDNSLSPKGQRQAQWLTKFVEHRISRAEWRDLKGAIYSSPKRRCQETVSGLAKVYGCEIQVVEDLNEQMANESFAKFNDRIHKFLGDVVRQGPPVVVVCGHGDWLPLAIFHLLGISIEMKKGSLLEIEWVDDQGRLTWYIPSFKTFYG